MALTYLHDNNIIHRDLSSNNVLLIGAIRAKVADFGMAKLVDQCSPDSRSMLTKYAGTNTYLPCELEHTDKVDCFSFGVVTIQMLTRQAPNPSKRFVEAQGVGGDSGSVFHKKVSEFDRRKSHIDKIDSKHPLKSILRDCLEDKPADRPSAKELCKRLTALKGCQEYEDSKKAAALNSEYAHGGSESHEAQNGIHSNGTSTDRDCIAEEQGEQILTLEKRVKSQEERLAEREKVIAEQQDTIKENDELIKNKDAEIERLKERVDQQPELRRQIEQLRSCVGEKDQIIAESERSVANTQNQLSICKSEKDTLAKQFHDLDLRLQHKDILRLILRWSKDAKKLPQKMYRSNDAVVDGHTAYFRPATTKQLYRFSKSHGWRKLPDCVYDSSPIVIVDGLLTTVGGCQKDSCVDKLLSLNAAGNKWIESLPSMPTKRSHAAALCTGSHLIVAGGKRERGEVLNVVEVLSLENRQWATSVADPLCSLPEPCRCSTMNVLNGHLFITCGVNVNGNQTNLGYACSLSALYQSLQSRPQQSQNGHTSPNAASPASSPNERPETSFPSHSHTYSTIQENVWRRIHDLPLTTSACVSFQGRLLAIGGKNPGEQDPAAEIYVYSPITDTWEVIGHVLTGRASCFAAVLSDNELMVVGGYTTRDSVEFATVV